MQPFPTVQNYGYQNPYSQYNQQQQYNPVIAYQDRTAQFPVYGGNQYQQSQQQTLQGMAVDSIDVVKATPADMSGNMVYFPKTDGTEIYTKQLQADGTSRILTFKPFFDTEPINEPRADLNTVNEDMKALRDDIMGSLNAMNERFDKLEQSMSVPAVKNTTSNSKTKKEETTE